MKTFTCATLTGVGVYVMLSISCSKNDMEEPAKKKKTQTVCDVATFTQQYTGGETRYIFNKAYDLSGTRLTRIDAGLYSGGSIWDTVYLNLTYDNNKIYFISAQNSADTGLVLHIDNSGRPLRADVGQIIDGGFGPQEFSYQNGRLHNINIDSDWMRIWFGYDADGNNTQIVTDSTDGIPRIHHEYQYDRKKPAFQQFYLDEARGFSFNVLTILQGAGFFPELNGVNTRTRSTVHWGTYAAYDFKLVNHVYDKEKRLMQYQTASPAGGSPNATYNNNYNCAVNNQELITMAQ